MVTEPQPMAAGIKYNTANCTNLALCLPETDTLIEAELPQLPVSYASSRIVPSGLFY